MGERLIIIFSILSFILLITNTYAYQTCEGGYSPYPVKCVGGGGSAYTANSGNGSGIGNSELISIIWIIAGSLVIIYFAKKIFFRRR